MILTEVSPAGESANVKHLACGRSFATATAMLESALEELRAAEASLERQLSDIQCYRMAAFPSRPAVLEAQDGTAPRPF